MQNVEKSSPSLLWLFSPEEFPNSKHLSALNAIFYHFFMQNVEKSSPFLLWLFSPEEFSNFEHFSALNAIFHHFFHAKCGKKLTFFIVAFSPEEFCGKKIPVLRKKFVQNDVWRKCVGIGRWKNVDDRVVVVVFPPANWVNGTTKSSSSPPLKSRGQVSKLVVMGHDFRQ